MEELKIRTAGKNLVKASVPATTACINFCFSNTQELTTPGFLNKVFVRSIYKNTEFEKKSTRTRDIYLSIEVIQKILNKFLIEKKIPKEEIAEKLEITMNNLEKLLCKKSSYLIAKINLPLIKLFCETKFSPSVNITDRHRTCKKVDFNRL